MTSPTSDQLRDALAEHAEQVATTAPPLTPEQVDRLVVLLRAGKHRAHAA